MQAFVPMRLRDEGLFLLSAKWPRDQQQRNRHWRRAGLGYAFWTS